MSNGRGGRRDLGRRIRASAGQCKDGRVTTSSEEALARPARSFWAATYESAAPRPSCAEGLRVRKLFGAVRTVDVERRWMLSEPVLGRGCR